MTSSADVVVIGAGVVGASVAYETARRGMTVTVLESASESGTGCSFANAGLLSPTHVGPLVTKSNLSAALRSMTHRGGSFVVHPSARLAGWSARVARSASPGAVRDLAACMQEVARRSTELHLTYAERGLVRAVQAGSLDVYLAGRSWSRMVKSWSTGDGELLDAEQARQMEPLLGEVAGAVHHPEDAHVDSLEFVKGTLAAADDSGARLRVNCHANRLVTRAGAVVGVETESGVITAGHVVLAAGLSSVRLSQGIGVPLPLRGAKGHVLDLGLGSDGPSLRPITFKDERVVATPYADRLRLAGLFELGAKSVVPDSRRLQLITSAARRGMPGLDTTNVIKHHAGLRPMTPDGAPVIGPSQRYRNLVFATGHGMWGLVLAPATGEQVALNLQHDSGVDGWTPLFSPDRFSRRRGPRVAGR